MKPRYSGLLILFSIVGAGCSSQSDSNYYPLSEDQRCEYTWQSTTPTGGPMSGELVIRMDGTERIGDKIYFKEVQVSSGMPGAEPEVSYVRAASDGIYKRGTNIAEPETVIMKLPIEVGATWTTFMYGESVSATVEAIETVELLERSYPNSLKVTYSGTLAGQPFALTEYRAPDIGLVRMRADFAGMPTELTLESCIN